MNNSLPEPARLRFVLREEPLPADYLPRRSMDSPELMYKFFRDVIMTDENFEAGKEQFVCLLLDARLKLMGYHVLSLGTLTEAPAHPREIIRPVILSNAYGFVLMHNHPSGDPSPSRPDEVWTRRIIEAADLMVLRFLDHVIVGNKQETGLCAPYYSFRESGTIV